MSHILEEIQRRCEKLQKESPAYMKNRTYHLCMEDRRLSAFTQLWVERYKPCPFTMRDAAEGVRGCIVVSIRDSDGRMLDFISEAKKKVAAAEGEAQALKIKGDAEAEYNRKISASLSGLIVQQNMIEKWDGKLPTYGEVPTLFKSVANGK